MFRFALLSAGLTIIATPSVAAAESWAGAWGFAALGHNQGSDESGNPAGSYRYRVRLTQAGDGLRLTFSNADNPIPLGIAGVSIALPADRDGLAAKPGSMIPVRFSGATRYAIAPGQIVVSDAVAFPVRVGEEIVVTLHTNTPTYPLHMDIGAPPSGFVPGRDLTTTPGAEGLKTTSTRPHLSLVAVRNPRVACTIVAFGDSITDGAQARSTATRGWPGRLAERIATAPAGRRCGVVNSGIGSAQLLSDGYGGKAALIRAGRDMLAVPGATHVILLEGINDIGGSGGDGQPILTSDALIAGYRQMIAQAHQAGLKIIGGTITPFIGAGYYSPVKEAVRQRANAFIRISGDFDGVVDFDAAVRDPARPVHLNPAFDPGDHLHPNDAGYRAMGDAIDLELFTSKTSS